MGLPIRLASYASDFETAMTARDPVAAHGTLVAWALSLGEAGPTLAPGQYNDELARLVAAKNRLVFTPVALAVGLVVGWTVAAAIASRTKMTWWQVEATALAGGLAGAIVAGTTWNAVASRNPAA